MSTTIDVSNPKITVEIVAGGFAVDGSAIYVDIITGILPGVPGPPGPPGVEGPQGVPGVTDVWTKAESDARYVNIDGDTMTGAFTVRAPNITIDNPIGSSDIILNAPAGGTDQRNLILNKGGLNRWFVGATGAAESGSNAGSDFQLKRFDDTGAQIVNAIHISRRYGLFGINGNVTGTSSASSGMVQVRTEALAAAEFGLALINPRTASDGESAGLLFNAGNGNRAAIRGEKIVGATNGQMIFSAYTNTTKVDVLTLKNDKSVVIAGDSVTVATAKTPASAAASGIVGQICWDANFVYVCVAANSWKRAALAAW